MSIAHFHIAGTALAIALTAALLARPVEAAPQIDAPAPAFSGTTMAGETISLSDFTGQTVVLEWTNHDCPFVRKHYGAGNMQATQAAAAEQGVVWISVISSAPGEQGYVDAAEAQALTRDRGATVSHLILDPEGTIGRAYEAKTTPHMYIIDGEGALVYMGGIDSIPSANPADIELAENYVLTGLAQLAAGERISTPITRPYGCSVKYAN